jgi:hypothetical protein
VGQQPLAAVIERDAPNGLVLTLGRRTCRKRGCIAGLSCSAIRR